MTLTKRGENAVLVLILAACFVVLYAGFVIGQDWKQDRLNQERSEQGLIAPLTCEKGVGCA